MTRIGSGFDVHRLVEGRPLIIGGVKIDYHLGLDGHSDADVLIHALMDALLGAAGLRDIGHYFPADDKNYFGISSIKMLEDVKNKLDTTGWKLINADMIIIAEAPKMAPYIEAMCNKIAEALGAARCRVAVKATTTEGLGFCGRGEGIAAQAVVLIEKAAEPGPVRREAE
ncbi:MAG: 2-C-methyl-D-erythritol 2,4-cyclodiphosphate synthase [Bacillota bacterium]|nr:2-C-methyl-D-erythritol 2,4-cyclodiphosphate synthase [Bacillota bacterium]MDW7730398.1 2-C-methyl-D-erythritol 2,4-cyclodiphosphate synthase [Bacillota bacterium]